MKTIKQLKNAFRSISCWFDQHFGLDRLTVLPRKINANSGEKKMLMDLRKLYCFSLKSNIAVTGGETSGKKSFVKTFETTRWFPVGKFLHIDIIHFAEQCGNTKDYGSLQTALDTYIEHYIISRARAGELPGLNDRLVRGPERIYRKPLIAFMVAFLMRKLLYTKDQWIDCIIYFLPKTWESQAIDLAIRACCVMIMIACCISIIKSVVALWPPRWITKIKATAKVSKLEVSLDADINRSEYCQNIIYALYKMRWQIGHTVVFENLEAVGEEVFPKIVSHLCSLNKRINEYGKSWKLWDITPFRRPIRFFYIYRDDLVQLKMNKPFFDKTFRILPNVTVDNVFYELKKFFEIEVSKGAVIPIEKLFPFDPNYIAHVSKHLVNRRLLNEIVRDYIYEYEDFVSRTNTTPSENDIHRLFSFVIYGLFFPKDRAKFASQTSILFTNESNKEDIDPQYSDLFEYLISDSCPGAYRINYLCMRFVGLCPDLLEEHIRFYKQAYEKKDYQTALIFIEKAICCQPENAQLNAAREEILQQQTNLSK